MDLTQIELDHLTVMSDERWHKYSAAGFFLYRKGLVDRRGVSNLVDLKSSGYEYQINQAGKDILTKTILCQNPECPKAGKCGGECARNF